MLLEVFEWEWITRVNEWAAYKLTKATLSPVFRTAAGNKQNCETDEEFIVEHVEIQ